MLTYFITFCSNFVAPTVALFKLFRMQTINKIKILLDVLLNGSMCLLVLMSFYVLFSPST